MKRAAILFSLCMTAALAASNWSMPLVGLARDAKNQLHPVYGVAGSFVLRGAMGGGALNWAFGASGGLLQTDGELQVLDARANVTERRAAPSSERDFQPRLRILPGDGRAVAGRCEGRWLDHD